VPKPKPYLYRNRPIGSPDYDYGQTVIRTGDQEVLSGEVQGMKASDLEERTARALSRMEIPFQFRVRITSDALGEQKLTTRFENVRGEVEIDFMAERNGQVTPIFVDGQIGHFFTPHQADVDKLKADIANEFGRRFGWKEAVRVPFWQLANQAMTDRTIEDIFL
jgi:hypothetical protein